jgi:hypothetical protein
MCKKAVVPNLKYYFRICLKGLRNITKKSQYRQYIDYDL